MAERYPVYATADVTVPTRDERKEVIAAEVIEALAGISAGDRGSGRGVSEQRGDDRQGRAWRARLRHPDRRRA